MANAIKFTEHGSVRLLLRIESDVHADAGADPGAAWQPGHQAWLTAEVFDTGIGVARDKLESIFEPFVQADSSITRRYGGTGLGLTISRTLAELLGGSLTLRSTEGDGAQFCLRVPVMVSGAPDVPEVPALQSPGDRNSDPNPTAESVVPLKRVLLVEDNAINRMLAAEMLLLLDCEVTTAFNGLQAIDEAAAKSFDLIVMDLQMPDLEQVLRSLGNRVFTL